MNNVAGVLISIGGWIGAAEFLLAYMLVSKGRLAGDSLRYQALNLSASVLLLVNCAHTGAWPSAVANVFYLLVGANILLTVKRAYIAQLAHARVAAVSGWRQALRRRRT
ncbi:CBU_0592 family membrane protein [Actinomyces trachealis]|uniref:CBU_0592 family membrane protein n=1 Tax=Actinomyces trachealis TaxID=2763540 RepID=UPI0039A6331E